MLVSLTGGPHDGQTKNIKQRSTAMGKPIPLGEKLVWPMPGHKRATYLRQSEGSTYTPAEYRYDEAEKCGK